MFRTPFMGVPVSSSMPDDVYPAPPATVDLQRLPLVPLHDAVHFPRTELRLKVVEAEYCRFFERVAHLAERVWIGTVLLKTGREGRARPLVYDQGTGARLMGHRPKRDGCEIVLRGEFRFAVDREISGEPCRHAWVRRLQEAPLSDRDPKVVSLREELLARTLQLADELGERFDLGSDQLQLLDPALPFETMVNHLAAHIDMVPRRKLQLLREPVPDRARHLLEILRRRQQILDALRPYRHLARWAEWN